MGRDSGNRDTIDAPDRLPGDLFELLSDHRRRLVLVSLSECGPSLSFADLAKEVTARERETPISALDYDDIETVYISLYHQHIPMLSDAGCVEFDRDRDVVKLTEWSDRLERIIAISEDVTYM